MYALRCPTHTSERKTLEEANHRHHNRAHRGDSRALAISHTCSPTCPYNGVGNAPSPREMEPTY